MKMIDYYNNMDVPSVQELLQRQIDEENETDRQINIHEQRDHQDRGNLL